MSDASLILLTRTIEQALLPPGAPLILCLIGLVLARRRIPYAMGILGLGLGLAYVSSLPLTAAGLARVLEIYPPVATGGLCERRDAAIVVLGGPDRYARAPEYGGDTLGALSLERVRYAAHLQRTCGLPLLAVGGRLAGEGATGAEMMGQILTREFGVPVAWTDGRSRSTSDNARFAAEILLPQGFESVVVVTHAWHMRRAVAAFSGLGLKVLPAPTGFLTQGSTEQGWRGLLPSAGAQLRVRWMLRELAGLAVMAMRPPRQSPAPDPRPVTDAEPARGPGSAAR